MKKYRVKTKEKLLDLVGASGPDPHDRGPIVVHATLWDARIVTACYYNGPKFQHPDAETNYDIFYDLKPLVPLVDRLLETGESFVTVTGESDMVCSLEWSIEAAPV